MSDFLKTYFFLSVVVEFAGRRIERDRNLLAWLESGLRDRFEHDLDGFGVRLQRRSESAFVAHGGVVALLLEHALQDVKGLHSPAQRFAKRRRAHRHHHEFLKIDVAVGMGATVEDVHHRSGQQAGRESAEVLVQLDAQVIGHGARGCHRDRENRVGSQLALVGRSVQLAHAAVDLALVAGVHAFEFGSDELVHVVDRFQNALADVARLVAIAQFDGFVLAGGRSAGNGSAASRAASENDVGFNGWISAGIQNFACDDQFDLSHRYESLSRTVGFASQLPAHESIGRKAECMVATAFRAKRLSAPTFPCSGACSATGDAAAGDLRDPQL